MRNSMAFKDVLMEHIGSKCELYVSCCGCFIKMGSQGQYPSYDIAEVKDDYVTLKAPDEVLPLLDCTPVVRQIGLGQSARVYGF